MSQRCPINYFDIAGINSLGETVMEERLYSQKGLAIVECNQRDIRRVGYQSHRSDDLQTFQMPGKERSSIHGNHHAAKCCTFLFDAHRQIRLRAIVSTTF